MFICFDNEIKLQNMHNTKNRRWQDGVRQPMSKRMIW